MRQPYIVRFLVCPFGAVKKVPLESTFQSAVCVCGLRGKSLCVETVIIKRHESSQ